MQIAALTHVYNEKVNLPIWVAHYGRNFGAANLFVFDHGSTDGSTLNLGEVNVIRVPHTPFDDVRKSITVSSLHTILLQHYDCAIVSDCDEIVIPDPDKYENLRQYIETVKPQVSACIGLVITHILTHELPIDLNKPILSQRRIARFSAAGSKPMISSVPTRWLPGGHASSVRPVFDPALFVFHIKFMDYSIATKRQVINAENSWSEAQQASRHGLHHRVSIERFVHSGFLVPMDVVRRGKTEPFAFEKEIAAMEGGIAQRGGMFILGEAEQKFVEIPERFNASF